MGMERHDPHAPLPNVLLGCPVHASCYTYLPPANGMSKVMFSYLSVILSRGVGGSHVTITHDALHLTVQSHPSRYIPGAPALAPLDPRPLAHGTLTCGGHH